MGIKKQVRTDNMKKLNQIINDLKNKKIKIGIFGSEGSDILMIAKVQEFGFDITITPKMRNWLHANGLHVKNSTTEIHIPERSFIRGSFDENKNKIDRFIKDNMEQLISFSISTNTFFDRVGQYLVGLTQEYLTELSTPPNHPFTLERKAPKSNPLISSGRMRSSITFKIE